jgi:predicted transcriptional regulator
MFPDEDRMQRSIQGTDPNELLNLLPATTEEILQRTSLTRPMVINALNLLRRQGLIIRNNKDNKWLPMQMKKGGTI